MLVFLNDSLVPEPEARVSVFDRGFLYGDALFETLRVWGGRPFQWQPHLDRMRRGADFLRLPWPVSPEQLRANAQTLIERNQLAEAILRLTLSRGVGSRGYSPRAANRPCLVMTLAPAPTVDRAAPPRWRLAVASIRVRAADPLAAFKTANKLPQVLARAEAQDRGADEALLLNEAGEVAEASAANVFWVEAGTVRTPPLSCGALPGVTRATVLELCQTHALPCREAPLRPAQLRAADGVFLTLSTQGMVDAISLDGAPLRQSPLVDQLRRAYGERVRAGAA